MAANWWDSYKRADDEDKWWESYQRADEPTRDAGGGRGFINPPMAYEQQPERTLPPVRTRVPAEEPTTTDYSQAATDMMGTPMSAPQAPRGQSVLDQPSTRDRTQDVGFMLRPEFVEKVRNDFAKVPPELRREALIAAASGENGVNPQVSLAAQRILEEVKAEDAMLQSRSLLRQGLIDLVANAQPGQPAPRKGGLKLEQGPAPRVDFPDMTPRLRDILEMTPESERVARTLRRDAATRGVVAAETGIEAIADRAKEAENRRDRTVGEYLGDLGTRLEQGGILARQVIANSIDPTSEWATELRGKAKAAEQELSPQARYQAQQIAAKLAEQPDELGKFGTMLAELVTNPTIAVEEIVRQGPLLGAMIGVTVLGAPAGALVTRGVMAAAPRVALADAISGGAVTAAGRAVGAATAARGGAAVAAGGGAANTVYEELTSKKNEALMRDNPDVKRLMDEGKTFEEARSEVAATKARLAQGIAATGGAVFGAAGFEGLLAKKVAGQAVKTTGTRAAATELTTELADELTTTGATNLAIGQVDPNRSLTQDFGQTAATALVTTAPLAGASAYMGSRAPEQSGNPALDPYARAVLDPQNYEPETISPLRTTRAAEDVGPSAPIRTDAGLISGAVMPPAPAAADAALDNIRGASTIDDAISNLSTASGDGMLDTLIAVPTAPAPMLASGEMGTPAIDARSPLTPQQLQANTDLLSQSPASLATPAPADTTLDAAVPSGELEARYGLDQLRALNPAAPAPAPMAAPRPSTIRGTPVAQLTDADLQQIVGDETAPPISRRSASIELTARQAQAPELQQTATTASLMAPFAGTQGVPSATVQTTGPAAQTGATSLALDTQPGAVGLPDTPTGMLGGDPATAQARARAQRALDVWAKREKVEKPIKLGTATPEEEAAVNQIAEALGSQFGGQIFAFSDPVSKVEGVTVAGRAFVNTAAPVINSATTALHEFKHTVEQIAKAETDAGMTGTAAQQFTQQIDSIFDDISEPGKRVYVERFLHKDELDAIFNPKTGKGTGTKADREARLVELMAAPKTRSEMTADFLGNRATDKQFWREIAQQDPQGFTGFVQKWIGIVDNLLAKLKGDKSQKRQESARVDTYIRDLQKAKMVAREALIAYSKATQAEAAAAAQTPTKTAVDTALQETAPQTAMAAPAGSALALAQSNNTFTGQAPGAGRSVGMTQPKGTPVEKLFSNFADMKLPKNWVDQTGQKRTREQAEAQNSARFREGMFARANKSPQQFAKDPLSTQTFDLGDGVTVQLDAAKAGNTRVQLRVGNDVVAAAAIQKGMVDAIAVPERFKGNEYGAKLLKWVNDNGVANIEEVPDRSPGFVAIQKKVLGEARARQQAEQETPTAETPQFSAARRGGTVEQAGDFQVRTQKDGTLGVAGDVEAIRALLPENVRGRAVPGGLVFTTSDAPRVRAALEGRKVAYSRGGQVVDKLPMKGGKYVGAPEKYNTPGKITALRKSLRKLALEGEPGRFWYENSSREVLAMTGGNVQEARKLVALLSIYSPQAKVDANSTFGLRAWAQYKAGQQISVKTGVQDEKARRAMEDVDAFWSGEKTGNFFFNLLREIDPSTAGKQGATIDMWMMRAGEYKNDAPTATQYAFMENETNRLAQELGWEPQQVQAAIWVAMKARMENAGVKKRTEASSEKKGWIRYDYPLKNGRPRKTRVIINAQAHRDNWLKHAFEHNPSKSDTQGAKFDFSDGLRRHIGQLSWEARPGRSTNVLPGVNDAPYEQQVEFQQAMQRALLDDDGVDLLAYKLGLLVDGPDILAPGVWQGEVAAGMQKLVGMAPAKGDAGKTSIDPAQKQAVETYASMLGLLLRQEGVGYHRPFYAGKKSAENGVDVNIGRAFSPAEAQEMWGALDARMRATGIEDWESGAGMISSPTGMRVVNFGALQDNAKFRALVQQAAGTLSVDEVKVGAFSTDGDLVMNDWKENPNGEGYRSRIAAAGSPHLLDWARDVLAPRVQSVFNEFSSKYGWGDPGDVDSLFQERAAQAEEVAPAEPSPAPEATLSRTRTRAAAEIPLAELRGRQVSMPVRVEDTGETGTLTMDAGDSLADINEREAAMQRLLECLRK